MTLFGNLSINTTSNYFGIHYSCNTCNINIHFFCREFYTYWSIITDYWIVSHIFQIFFFKNYYLISFHIRSWYLILARRQLRTKLVYNVMCIIHLFYLRHTKVFLNANNVINVIIVYILFFQRISSVYMFIIINRLLTHAGTFTIKCRAVFSRHFMAICRRRGHRFQSLTGIIIIKKKPCTKS